MPKGCNLIRVGSGSIPNSWNFPLVVINQGYNKIIFDRGILVILCLYGDGVGRGVAFVIKNSGGFEGAIGIEREQRIIIFPAYEVVSDRIPIGIGGIELTHSSASRLVFQYGQCSGRIKIARRAVRVNA